MTFHKFWILNFVNINIEKFPGINFVISITEFSYFWHLVLSCRLWTFWYFYSKIYVPLTNCNINFLQICKDIWKQLKTIIIVAVSIIVTEIDIFIVIFIWNIIAELTESSEFTLIPSFNCLLIAKVYMGKIE